MDQPLLSIIVPCYNSADYLDRCVESLLAGDHNVELLLVDDGSTDATPQLVDQYQAKFPKKVRALHQPNGGHGQAINTGLAHTSGVYLKVVDSDDWLDHAALDQIMAFLNKTVEQDNVMDMVIANFVFDKQGSNHKKVMSYPQLPTDRVFNWEEVHFPFGKYLLMHSVIYRTSMVRDEAQLQLPKHTFYVDNIYVFEPLIYVHKIYYLNINLYHYFLGRDDQSVNDAVMISRADQQLKVNRIMLHFYVAHPEVGKHLKAYLSKYLQIITTITSVLLIEQNTPASLAAKKDLWHEIKDLDRKLYRHFRHSSFGVAVNLPGKVGRKMTVGTYRMAEKLYGFE